MGEPQPRDDAQGWHQSPDHGPARVDEAIGRNDGDHGEAEPSAGREHHPAEGPKAATLVVAHDDVICVRCGPQREHGLDLDQGALPCADAERMGPLLHAHRARQRAQGAKA